MNKQNCSCDILTYFQHKDTVHFNTLMILFLAFFVIVIVHMFNMKAQYSYIFDFLSGQMPPTAYSPWQISLALYYPWVAKLLSDPFLNPNTPRWISLLIAEFASTGNFTPWSLFGSFCNGQNQGSNCPDPNSQCLYSLGLLASDCKTPTYPQNPTGLLSIIPYNSRIVQDYLNSGQGGINSDQGFNLLSVINGGFVALSENNSNLSVAQLYDYCFGSYPAKSANTCNTAQTVNNYIKNAITYGGLGAMFGPVTGVGGLIVGIGLSLFQQQTGIMEC
jgi:hypothetical protein